MDRSGDQDGRGWAPYPDVPEASGESSAALLAGRWRAPDQPLPVLPQQRSRRRPWGVLATATGLVGALAVGGLVAVRVLDGGPVPGALAGAQVASRSGSPPPSGQDGVVAAVATSGSASKVSTPADASPSDATPAVPGAVPTAGPGRVTSLPSQRSSSRPAQASPSSSGSASGSSVFPAPPRGWTANTGPTGSITGTVVVAGTRLDHRLIARLSRGSVKAGGTVGVHVLVQVVDVGCRTSGGNGSARPDLVGPILGSGPALDVGFLRGDEPVASVTVRPTVTPGRTVVTPDGCSVSAVVTYPVAVPGTLAPGTYRFAFAGTRYAFLDAPLTTDVDLPRLTVRG